MKKRILLVAILVICLSVLASGTLAFFTTEAIARNVITTGGVGIDLVRLSCGIENADDIIADLDQALAAVQE